MGHRRLVIEPLGDHRRSCAIETHRAELVQRRHTDDGNRHAWLSHPGSAAPPRAGDPARRASRRLDGPYRLGPRPSRCRTRRPWRRGAAGRSWGCSGWADVGCWDQWELEGAIRGT